MEIKSVAYKCPACGASLEFDALTQNFVCHYCGSAFEKTELDQRFTDDELTDSERFTEEEKELAKKRGEDWEKLNVLYSCPSCGAGIFSDSESTVSLHCHYCNSPVILAGKLSGQFRPNKLIPFVKTREQAETAFKEWSGKRFFVPKAFKSDRVLAEMKGVYVPFWLADCCVEGTLEAIATKTSSIRHGDTVTTTHREYLVERQGSLICRGVPADGSTHAADLLMENIEPFDYSKLIDFDMSYLSGHNAEKYDVGKEAVFPRIEQRVREEAISCFKASATGYSSFKIVKSEFKINGVNWTYALLPVWFLSYFYKDQLYCYAMNGQTGKFSGRLPINKLKLGLCAAGAAILALLAGLLFFGGAL
ncbi:MAG: hypothetical protein NC084_06860 [Bacteroides sp.]|nr:hypothetical protein [Eubacterium sp.]MCM1418317.1 hypothetical protein [Roseburia sp.]MCM1462420.1 hypothetical protein [Bacteroides sp.]